MEFAWQKMQPDDESWRVRWNFMNVFLLRSHSVTFQCRFVGEIENQSQDLDNHDSSNKRACTQTNKNTGLYKVLFKLQHVHLLSSRERKILDSTKIPGPRAKVEKSLASAFCQVAHRRTDCVPCAASSRYIICLILCNSCRSGPPCHDNCMIPPWSPVNCNS